MFKAEISDVDLLKNSIPIIAEIIDEGLFKITKDGISLLSPDRTMVSVIDFNLKPAAFDKFEVDEDVSIGLNLANFVSVLKRAKSSDKLVLEYEKGNKLKVIIKGSGTRSFEIPIIEIKTEKPPVEQLEFKGRIEIESSMMEEGIADAEIAGDSVIFEATKDSFKIYSKGDVSSTEMKIMQGDQGLIGVKAEGSVKARYPLEYLKKIIKAGKLSKQLVLEFGTDYPMRMSFDALDKLTLKIILAPRVEE